MSPKRGPTGPSAYDPLLVDGEAPDFGGSQRRGRGPPRLARARCRSPCHSAPSWAGHSRLYAPRPRPAALRAPTSERRSRSAATRPRLQARRAAGPKERSRKLTCPEQVEVRAGPAQPCHLTSPGLLPSLRDVPFSIRRARIVPIDTRRSAGSIRCTGTDVASLRSTLRTQRPLLNSTVLLQRVNVDSTTRLRTSRRRRSRPAMAQVAGPRRAALCLSMADPDAHRPLPPFA